MRIAKYCDRQRLFEESRVEELRVKELRVKELRVERTFNF